MQSQAPRERTQRKHTCTHIHTHRHTYTHIHTKREKRERKERENRGEGGDLPIGLYNVLNCQLQQNIAVVLKREKKKANVHVQTQCTIVLLAVNNRLDLDVGLVILVSNNACSIQSGVLVVLSKVKCDLAHDRNRTRTLTCG